MIDDDGFVMPDPPLTELEKQARDEARFRRMFWRWLTIAEWCALAVAGLALWYARET